MYFLYPNFLWALSLLSIPIIIHFFNIRRYKKIYFSHTQIIKQITQESQIKSKLKEYLILLTRLMALLFLVLAFAQPVKKNSSSLFIKPDTDVLIYIDNSFSMENIGQQGKLFELALTRAREIIQSFPKSTRFFIFTNDTHLESEKKLSQNEAIEYLSKIKVSSASLSLSILFNKIKTLHLSHPVCFLISDAQKKFTDVANLSPPDFPTYYFLLSATQKNNISIDSVWIDHPVVLPFTPQQLHIKLTNHNSENINDLPIKITLNQTQIAILNVSIPAHQSIQSSASFIPSDQTFQFGKVFINDYPVTFDDELYFSLSTHIRIRALLINGFHNPPSSQYFRTFFQNDSVFIFSEQQEKQLNFTEIAKQDVIVLNEVTEYSSGLEEQLKILSQQGKCIIIVPFIEGDQYALPSVFQKYQWKIDTNRQQINQNILSHPLFINAFEKTDQTYKMPMVNTYMSISPLAFAEPIIELNNGKLFLLKYRYQDFQYYLFASTMRPESTQLPLHSLFVPIMYQLCFTAIPSLPLYYYCETSSHIRIPNVQFTYDYSPKIISAEQTQEVIQIIPAFKTEYSVSYIYIPSHTSLPPGQYYLQWKNNNIYPLSFNYNRSESDMQFYTEQDLKNILAQYHIKQIQVNELSRIPSQRIIQSEISGTRYWKLCLILALIFFVTESMIIRWMK